ncbi:MAG: GNAT family N-acetyltransferase [Deltaproteobacteria bacterium]|nr:GNAT family N-acetyltransferase [Deltaproteobacteria bacterium]
MIVDTRQQHLIDHNFLLSMGLLMSNSVIGEFLDTYNIGIVSSGVPNKQYNVVFIKKKTSKPEKVIQKWEQFFELRGLPFRVLISPGFEDGYEPLMKEKGYREIEPQPAMILSDLGGKGGEETDLVIKRVVTPEELAHFQETVAEGFDFHSKVGPFLITERVRALPDTELFIGYADGRPASASMLIKTGDIAGIYWVATPKKYRRRGFGAAVTQHAVLAGRNRGCTLASLQASKMGKPVYERIGFVNCYNYRAYTISKKV